MSLLTIPRITWGAAFANQLDIEYPLDPSATRSYEAPKEGSEKVRGPSGEHDSWVIGFDAVLELRVMWITAGGTASGTGWDGVTGWSAFLKWAQEDGEFRWIPDKNTPGTFHLCELLEPQGVPQKERLDDWTSAVSLTIATVDASVFTGY